MRGSELGIELGEELSRHERRGRENDPVGLERLVDRRAQLRSGPARDRMAVAPCPRGCACAQGGARARHEPVHSPAQAQERRRALGVGRRLRSRPRRMLPCSSSSGGGSGMSPAARAARRRRRRCRSCSGSTRLSYASRPSRRETNEAIDSSSPGRRRRDVGLGGQPRPPSAESSALVASASRSVGIIPVRPSGSGWSSPPRADEAARVLRPPADELLAEAELLAKSDAALLAREEAVRRRPRSRSRPRARYGASRRGSRRSPRGRSRRRGSAPPAVARPRAPRSLRRRRRPSRRASLRPRLRPTADEIARAPR